MKKEKGIICIYQCVHQHLSFEDQIFDGSKPEVAKQHYERFNQYIKFQTKSSNIRDPISEAIELFEYTLDKKALVWFQEHKDEFVETH